MQNTVHRTDRNSVLPRQVFLAELPACVLRTDGITLGVGQAAGGMLLASWD